MRRGGKDATVAGSGEGSGVGERRASNAAFADAAKFKSHTLV